MKSTSVLKAVNATNILANVLYLLLLLASAFLYPYGAFALVAFSFPVLILLAVLSLIFNFNLKSHNKINGAFDTTVVVISVIISAFWLIALTYFMANIGF